MKKKKSSLYLFILAIQLLGLILLRFLGFDGLYGMDSYEYFRYSGEMRSFFLGGEHPGSFFWPKGYPLLVAFFALAMPVSFAGQLISLLSLYGIFWFSYQLSKQLYPKQNNKLGFLIISLLFAPYLMRNGVQVMSDLLAVFCLIASVYFSVRFYREKTTTALIWCSFFAFYGAFTRYGTMVPLVPVFLFVAYGFIKNFRLKFLLSFILPTVLLFIHFFFEAGGSEFSKHHFIEEWSFSNYFKRTFPSTSEINLASFTYTFPNIVYYFGLFLYPGFFFLNAVLLVLSVKRFRLNGNAPTALLLAIILLNSLFLSGVTYQGDRYLFPAYPLFAILLIPSFSWVSEKIYSYRKIAFALFILIQLGLCVRAIYPSYERNLLEKVIVEELKPFQGNTLYCFEMDLAVQQRGLEFEYKNLWTKEYESYETGSLVLFNPTKFKNRFQGKTPMQNWNRLTANHQLTLLKQFDSGWEIYRIES